MEAFQMRQLLIAIQQSANEDDCGAVRDLACAGLTILNGSDVEAREAWKEIEAGRSLSLASKGYNATMR